MKNSELLDQLLFFDLCDEVEEDHIEYNVFECQDCGENLLLNDNYMVCPRCGLCADAMPVQVFSDRPIFTKKSMYKQINHFKHILNTVQNRESKTIPDEVYYNLESHMENLDVSLENIRKCLKEMEQSKYYKHSVQLYCKLKGMTTMMCLSPAEEDKIISLFKKVRQVYGELENTKRKNFLNYSFLVAKLLINIGRYDLANLCKGLKNSALRNHNKIWGKICDRMPELFL